MEHDEALSLLRSDPGSTGIFCDFDGTLSPIVDSPEDARPLPGAVDVMEKLADRFAVVGLISGRSLNDLRSRFAPRGVLLGGSYGREGVDLEAPAERPWDVITRETTDACAALDGVVVEPKESGVAIHYRLSPHHEEAVGRIAITLAQTHALEVRRGRKVAELVAPGPGKAEALRALVREHDLDAFLFGGDDAADVLAFRWAQVSAIPCVLVGVTSTEAPTDLYVAADLVVDGPAGFLEFLEQLA